MRFPARAARRSLPPRNLHHERDIRYVTKVSSWILKSIGIWPAPAFGSGRFLSKIAIIWGNVVLCFAIVPCALHIVYEQKDTTMRLKLFGLVSFCIAAFIKYCALVVRVPSIRHCVEYVENDWSLVESRKDRELMLRYGKIGRNLTILCVIFMYTGGLIYHTILQMAIGSFVDENNRTIKPLVYPTYSALYDAQRSPVYEFVYLAHCMCGYVMYAVTTGACGLAALFATHACGQIDIITSRLEELVDGGESQASNADKRLSAIVRHHLRVLRFSAMIEKILQEVCLVEFVSSTFIICLLEYYCLTDWENRNQLSLATYAVLLVSLTFNIFILCYIGEILMEKTVNVGLSCFMIDWYRLPTKTARDLILIIGISHDPVKISAGQMITLSLSTFGNVLKTSLAYLSILRTATM